MIIKTILVSILLLLFFIGGCAQVDPRIKAHYQNQIVKERHYDKWGKYEGYTLTKKKQ